MNEKNQKMTSYTAYPPIYSLPSLFGEAKAWFKSIFANEKEANLELITHEVFLAARADVEFEKHKKIINKNNKIINDDKISEEKKNKLRAENKKIIALYASILKNNKNDKDNPLNNLENPNYEIFKKRLEEYGLKQLSDHIKYNAQTYFGNNIYNNLKARFESSFYPIILRNKKAHETKDLIDKYDSNNPTLGKEKIYKKYTGR